MARTTPKEQQMSLTVVRVDLFDDFEEITLEPNQTEQFGFNHAGFDANHWVMCSVSPIHTGSFTSVEIVRQWQNMQADGTTDHQVLFHNIDDRRPATFRPRFMVAPSLG